MNISFVLEPSVVPSQRETHKRVKSCSSAFCYCVLFIFVFFVRARRIDVKAAQRIARCQVMLRHPIVKYIEGKTSFVLLISGVIITYPLLPGRRRA